MAVRHKSGPYGYTQAKSLVFSRYGEPSDVLKLHTHSISPTLPSSSLLLRTLAAPINPADVNTIQGTYGVKPSFSPLIGTSEPSVIPGNEGVFEIISTSSLPSSSPLKKGDWVIPTKTGFGTWRTHAVAGADTVLRVEREGLSPTQAGTVAVNPCSAYRMLRDYAQPALREGDWFVQNGANSGVGRAAVQLGRLWGYKSINVIRSRESAEETQKLKDELKDLGATQVVTEEEFLSREFRDMVKEWTGSEGIRLGMNCVGGKSAQTMAKTLGSGGTLVTYGGMARQPVSLPTGLLIFKDIRFVGFWLSRWADGDKEGKERTVNEILEFMREGKFKDTPTVDVPWSWETKEGTLREAVQGTLEGFRKGKGVFVFGET
ncbi:zinc-binding dehydrogenase [Pseudomassariella vexata]|uniref:enoyl-[acyl-carrier-protein] reductase n=1 Tax=Pseudomassariella vexata TaxID=1141098 RepID=A0A1Y2E7V2_9PEZI|nr:zinc-binding dehydrogenase [Pseudomassariella vexata]ORY67641.1 zinc-binding dehydrogenase [Pseudomassariella vexata]